MLISLMVLTAVDLPADVYEIVDVHRTSIHAGKLGRLVHDNLTVKKDGKTYEVIVHGSYHTRCVRPAKRLAEGQMITIPGSPNEDGKIRVWLDRIRIGASD